MTLKQQIHSLVDELPDDSPLLAEFEETLRLNRALAEGLADVREGRVLEANEFLAKVDKRWPKRNSA